MLDVLDAAVGDAGLRTGLIVTAFGFGLRHGVDWDHIAAITDIAGTTRSPRTSMRLATLYAGGHGLVVFALGSAAVLAGDFIPAGIDAAMGRAVGVTLLLLGAWVLVGLARRGRDFRMRSRWMLLFDAARRARRWRRPSRAVVIEHEHDHDHGSAHRHDHEHADRSSDAETGGAVVVRLAHRHRHVHRGTLPPDPFVAYGSRTSFAVGMLHGIGAETPTQVLLFLTAARAGGTFAGEVALVAFVAGLIDSNTAIAAASTFGFLNAGRHFRIYAAVAVITGSASVAIGTLLVLGQDSRLPAFFSG